MFNPIELSITHPFGQVVAADLGCAQVIVPTTTEVTRKRVFGEWVEVPVRRYASTGWLLVEGTEVATLHGLEIGAIASLSIPFKIQPRLGPAVPMGFEARSVRSLPPMLLAHASFACR